VQACRSSVTHGLDCGAIRFRRMISRIGSADRHSRFRQQVQQFPDKRETFEYGRQCDTWLAMDNIVIVHYPSERPENWSLLKAAARSKALHLTTWYPHLIEIVYSDADVKVFFNGKPAYPDVLIHRTVSPFRGILVPALTCLSSQGTLVLNDAESSFRARDKLLTDLTLRAAAIPVVPAVAFDEPGDTTFSMLGHERLILKPAHGVRGEGIETVSASSATTIAARLHQARLNRVKAPGFYAEREHYLAQILIDGGGKDLRAYVVGSSCAALMRREAQAGEVRANLALGASATPLSLTHPAARVAEAALVACGLDFGAVDMVEDRNGELRVIEVDAWGGFAGITKTTGVDVAGAILDYAKFRQKEGPES
jgi:ribosomal protein S6--L-glutamate ligase